MNCFGFLTCQGVFKFACTCATTSSIPNLALSRRSSCCDESVFSWMLPDFAHIHKNFDRLSKLISCNVITLYPFPSRFSQEQLIRHKLASKRSHSLFSLNMDVKLNWFSWLSASLSSSGSFWCLGLSGDFCLPNSRILNSVPAIVFHALEKSR